MATCIVEATSGQRIAGCRREELELDLAQLASVRAQPFLEACAIGEDMLDRVIARAQAIVTEWGSALLRVELGGEPPTATACPPPALRSQPVPGTANC